MNPFFSRRALAAAVLALAACAGSDDERARPAADSAVATQPAGTQPAPTAQHQAAPQTGPNTPQAADAEAPVSDQAERAKQPHVRPDQTYAGCMARARAAASADERALLQHTCASLPGAPKA
jgi:hypothetical protein